MFLFADYVFQCLLAREYNCHNFFSSVILKKELTEMIESTIPK